MHVNNVVNSLNDNTTSEVLSFVSELLSPSALLNYSERLSYLY